MSVEECQACEVRLLEVGALRAKLAEAEAENVALRGELDLREHATLRELATAERERDEARSALVDAECLLASAVSLNERLTTVQEKAQAINTEAVEQLRAALARQRRVAAALLVPTADGVLQYPEAVRSLLEKLAAELTEGT